VAHKYLPFPSGRGLRGGECNSFYPPSPRPWFIFVKGEGAYIRVSQVPQTREKSKDVLIAPTIRAGKRISSRLMRIERSSPIKPILNREISVDKCFWLSYKGDVIIKRLL
jgi:hypothetical protein